MAVVRDPRAARLPGRQGAHSPPDTPDARSDACVAAQWTVAPNSPNTVALAPANTSYTNSVLNIAPFSLQPLSTYYFQVFAIISPSLNVREGAVARPPPRAAGGTRRAV